MLSFLLLLLSIINIQAKGMTGGYGEQTKVSENQDLVDLLATLENKIKDLYDGEVYSIAPLDYKMQVVAGMNYFVSYSINDAYAVIKVYNPLPYTHEDPQITESHFHLSLEEMSEMML